MPRKPSLTRQPSLPTRPADITHAETVIVLGSLVRGLEQLTEQVKNLKHQLEQAPQLPTDTFTLLATQEKRLFTVEELAQLLKVDRRVIYGLRHKGLPAHHVGRELRFDLLEVKAWLEVQQRG
jgi:excisionase family DNA binding protein